MNNPRNFLPNFEAWRMRVFLIAMVVVFGFYTLRLIDLQVVQGAELLSRAEENRIRTINLATQRGSIYDRNGYPLATNTASYNVVITPAGLPADEGAVQEIYRRLGELIDWPASQGELTDEVVKAFSPCETDLGISQIVFIQDTNAPYSPVRIKCNIDQKTAMIVREKASDWPGVGIEIEPVREYPTGQLTAEIIGFLGPIPADMEREYGDQGFVSGRDKVGYAGVEYSMQAELGGKNGLRTIEEDAAGKEIRDLVDQIDPLPGNNIRLTIDTRLQLAARTALVEEMRGWNAFLNENRMTNGVVIAMNPKTGEILALVSYPSYENNRLARLIPAYYYEQLIRDPHKPLFNHAISSEHPPGSVYKLAAAIGVLNEGVIDLNYKIKDPGKITILQKFSPNDPGIPRDYVCWDEYGHGEVDWMHGVAWSCDVFFYKISGGYQDEVPAGLNVWRMKEYAEVLGYGALTGIELPGEATGLVPDPDWKRRTVGENWATGDTYIASMGQGFVLATPLQVLVSIATLANDGKYMRPTIIREIFDADGKITRPFEPEMVWDITQDPLIDVFDENQFLTGEKKVVEPWVVQKAKEAMRMVVQEGGTAEAPFKGEIIPSAGKTGTAEYCDDVAQSQNRCTPGNWPAHAWYVGYAPFDDPEIAVVAFVYGGNEGATVAAPVVRKVFEAYFELKTIDANLTGQ